MSRLKSVGLILVMILSLLIISVPTVTAQANWYDQDFTYRRSVIITGVAGAGTDYQVYLPITYDTDMQADFDDLRFADDAGLPIDYWIETYVASTSAVVYVEVTDNLDSNQTIYMYYGNSTVSTTSNGTDTFLFYEDWASETVDPTKWDTITSDGSISFDDTDANHGSVIEIEGNAGANVYELRTVDTVSAPTSIIGRLNIEETAGASQRTVWGMGSQSAVPLVLVRSNEGSEEFLALDDDSNADSLGLLAGNFDTYRTFKITRDGTDAKLYADYILVAGGGTVSCSPDTVANVVVNLYVRDSEYQLYCDWTAQTKFIANGPVGGTFGDEETFQSYLTTQDVIDRILIFAGLIMIPLSTALLVYGGQKKASMDKLFYFLILFMVGLGLLVGGIMP